MPTGQGSEEPDLVEGDPAHSRKLDRMTFKGCLQSKPLRHYKVFTLQLNQNIIHLLLLSPLFKHQVDNYAATTLT